MFCRAASRSASATHALGYACSASPSAAATEGDSIPISASYTAATPSGLTADRATTRPPPGGSSRPFAIRSISLRPDSLFTKTSMSSSSPSVSSVPRSAARATARVTTSTARSP